ncbi:hypothetical protein D3C85_1584950 [compost metagenome]
MDAMTRLLSSSRRDLRLAPPRSMLGTRVSPRNICGTSEVKAADCAPVSAVDRRLRKPER